MKADPRRVIEIKQKILSDCHFIRVIICASGSLVRLGRLKRAVVADVLLQPLLRSSMAAVKRAARESVAERHGGVGFIATLGAAEDGTGLGHEVGRASLPGGRPSLNRSEIPGNAAPGKGVCASGEVHGWSGGRFNGRVRLCPSVRPVFCSLEIQGTLLLNFFAFRHRRPVVYHCHDARLP